MKISDWEKYERRKSPPYSAILLLIIFGQTEENHVKYQSGEAGFKLIPPEYERGFPPIKEACFALAGAEIFSNRTDNVNIAFRSSSRRAK